MNVTCCMSDSDRGLKVHTMKQKVSSYISLNVNRLSATSQKYDTCSTRGHICQVNYFYTVILISMSSIIQLSRAMQISPWLADSNLVIVKVLHEFWIDQAAITIGNA